MSSYSIQDLAHLSGVKPHTIRIWEQRYKLINPKRTNTNIRTYNDIELKKLLNVSLLLNSGHKISKVATLSESQLISEVNNVQYFKFGSAITENSINQFINAMIDFDEETFDNFFTASLLKIGFEKTIIETIYPFLQRVGILWGMNKISPAQEHFISNIIRNKIIAASENQTFSVYRKSMFILFLPSNEYHELAILLTSYILKGFGFKVIYLGSNVPASSLLDALSKFKSCNLFTHITFPLEKPIVDDLKKIVQERKYSKFFLSGNANYVSEISNSKFVSYCPSIEDFKTTIHSFE